MENENKIFNPIPEVITIPEDYIIISDTAENDISELPPPPPQISIFD